MAVTPGGLRYPGPTDLVADTPVYINNLAADVAAKLAQVNYIVSSAGVQCDSGGNFTLPISAFKTLRGFVYLYTASPSDVWTMMPLITGLSATAVGGQMWYMDRDAGGYSNRAYSGGVWIMYMAWGDPK